MPIVRSAGSSAKDLAEPVQSDGQLQSTLLSAREVMITIVIIIVIIIFLFRESDFGELLCYGVNEVGTQTEPCRFTIEAAGNHHHHIRIVQIVQLLAYEVQRCPQFLETLLVCMQQLQQSAANKIWPRINCRQCSPTMVLALTRTGYKTPFTRSPYFDPTQEVWS